MLNNALTPETGIIILFCYGIAMILLTLWVIHGKVQSKPEFLLSSRSVGVVPGAMSIAASWIWAPALFVSSEKTYTQGVAGLFWYLAPNVATLIIFGPFAAKLRSLMPDGYTLPQYMKLRHGRGVHILYLIQFFGLQICSFAVQLLAGATFLHAMTGINYTIVAAALVIIVVSYATLGGLRASVATDYVQMVAMLIICGAIVPWAVMNAGGLKTLVSGIGGVTGEYTNPVDPWIGYSFGIPIAIGLLSGPLGDQMQWQRAFALKKQGKLKRTYLLAALLFACVPLTLCNLGFITAAKSASGIWHVADTQMVGPLAIANLLPHFMIIVYVLMLLGGLCATMDSALCAVSSLAATDLFKSTEDPKGDKLSVQISRWSMLVAALIGFAVAHIPGLKILHLFLFYGTFRASTMIPTIATLYQPKINSRVIFATILVSLLVGGPLLVTGYFINNVHVSVAGSLAVVATGLCGCLFLPKFTKYQY